MEPIGTVNPAKQVLIVDDERHVTYLMQHKMQKMGLDVLTARNGQEAMEKAVEVVPDLIITDFQMPGGSVPKANWKLPSGISGPS